VSTHPSPAFVLIWRALLPPRRAAVAGCAGIAACVLLVLALTGALGGVSESVQGYAGQARVSLWVAPKGSDNLVRSSAVLPTALADSLLTVPGIAQAGPVLRVFVSARSAGVGSRAPVTLLALGYRAPGGPGGPPRLLMGRPPGSVLDAAIDRAAAYRLAVRVGDSLRINGRTMFITGITEHTDLLATQFLFVDLNAAQMGGGFLGRASFIAVALAPGVDSLAIAATIRRRFTNLEVFTRSEFVDNNLREVGSGFVPVLALVALLGSVAAALIVAVLAYHLGEARRHEVAVLFALGAHDAPVTSAVVLQGICLVGIAALSGFATAVLLRLVLIRALPIVTLSLSFSVLSRILVGFTAVAALATTLPLRRLQRTDPLESFRP
jgi:ABC-type antimicrobial peptide transport system permease subunit